MFAFSRPQYVLFVIHNAGKDVFLFLHFARGQGVWFAPCLVQINAPLLVQFSESRLSVNEIEKKVCLSAFVSPTLFACELVSVTMVPVVC